MLEQAFQVEIYKPRFIHLLDIGSLFIGAGCLMPPLTARVFQPLMTWCAKQLLICSLFIVFVTTWSTPSYL